MAKKQSPPKAAPACCPDKNTVLKVASAIFALVGLLHLWRALSGMPAVLGSWVVPLWISWPALVVAFGLSWWACKASRY